MKHMRRLFALLLAVLMVAGMTVTAAADEDPPVAQSEFYTITINGDCDKHTYEAYQIFTGELHIDATNGSKVLSNIKWGKNARNKTESAEVGDEILENFSEQKAIELVDFSTPFATSSEPTESFVYTISNLPAGYYLVKDEDNSLNGTTAAYTTYILQIVEDSTVSPKSSAPKLEKKVEDSNDSEDDPSGWQDSADHDIGDEIPFRITAELSSNLESYKDDYKLIFHDTMSAGLDYVEESVVVYIDGNTLSKDYSTDYDQTKHELTITIPNARAVGAVNSSKVTITYKATLNKAAVIGGDGNDNTVYLEYSNNPNWTGESDELGETPKDTVTVFTYKLQVNKVHKVKTDADGEPVYEALTGAGFTLYKQDGISDAYVPVGEEVTGEEMTEFTWTGLDDGAYKLVETTTPEGYNTIDPIFFTITADHEILSDDPTLKSLSGNTTTGEAAFTVGENNSQLSADVVNQKGATLPETGGMGTTLFYIVGGILVLAAVVLLVSKKRMTNAE